MFNMEPIRKLSLLPNPVPDADVRRSSLLQTSFPPLKPVEDAPVKILPSTAAPPEPVKNGPDLDAFLKRLGNPGRYQILLYVMLCASYFLIAPNNLAMIFLAAEPSEYICTDSSFRSVNSTGNRTSKGGLIKREDVYQAEFTPGPVQQCKVTKSWPNRKGIREDFVCDRWEFPLAERNVEAKTVITDFGLICEHRWKSSLANTIYFIGNVVGAVLFGYMGDRFGRRVVVLGTGFLAVVFGAAAAYAPNYVGFTILRFILGISVQGIQGFYALMMEWFPSYQRAVLGTLSECFWGGGVIILALWGYIFSTWHTVQLAIALTGLVLLVAHYFLVEDSLRWLLVSDRTEQAYKVTTKVLRINGLGTEISPEMKNELLQIGSSLRNEDNHQVHYSFIDCFRTRRLRKISLCLMYIWFSLALGYYGLSFSVDSLVGSAPLNLFIGGLLEMIPYCGCAYAVPRYGRKMPLIVLNTVSGVFCIISGVIPSAGAGGIAKTVLALLGRMAVAGSFCSVIVWTSELYPTVIRSNGLGIVMCGLRLGSVLAPQIVLLGHYTFQQLPVIVLGAGVLLGAVFAWFLEETLNNEHLPDTMHDLEKVEPSKTPANSTVSNYESAEECPAQTTDIKGQCICGH